MPVPRTADYVAMGRNHAQNAIQHPDGLQSKACPRESKSWQAKAFWSGYDEEMERLKSSAVLQRPKGPSSAWPSPEETRESMYNARSLCKRHAPILSVVGPLYPKRVKGRSRRGWTTPA